MWELPIADLRYSRNLPKVVFHADDGFLGVFFRALHNMNYTPGLAH